VILIRSRTFSYRDTVGRAQTGSKCDCVQKIPAFLRNINFLLITFCFSVAGYQEVIMAVSRLINRNIVAGRGRTSMRLEPEIWDMLSEICKREARDMSTLVRQIEAAGHVGGRTSAVRVYIAKYFHIAATEHGHAAMGHGLLINRVPDLAAA
jgi:predicted DNA-binding ribbon-helix-helix protein